MTGGAVVGIGAESVTVGREVAPPVFCDTAQTVLCPWACAVFSFAY